MSLVAYAASSDEESDYSDAENTPATSTNPSKAQTTTKELNGNSSAIGGISDDDEDYAPTEYVPLSDAEKKPLTLTLPKPKHQTAVKTIEEEMDEQLTPTFAKLPMPKHTTISNVIEEEDDEFLHKKATIPVEEALEKPPPPPTTSAVRGPVKITIPSLKEFSDVEQELASKTKSKATTPASQKKSGLLSMLPTAKSEQNFAKTPATTPIVTTSAHTEANGTARQPPVALATKVNPFIPDTVKNRRPAHNTEGVDGIKRAPKRTSSKAKAEKPKISLVDCSESEGSDEESTGGGDFFSLNAEEKLPEVSANEINAMVAQRAAKMATASTKYLNALESKPPEDEQMQLDEEMLQAQKRYQDSQLDQAAVQALVGNSAKRRRKEKDIHVLDISSEQVLPSRDEWMRTALASSTAYQATGVLTDEEPAAGTRRKHQITYLAHKAKANEAELQAMWATNRQNRRATQSKYGF